MHLVAPPAAAHGPHGPYGLVLLAPGGGQDHRTPHVAAHAERVAAAGWLVAVVRSLDHVPALLGEHAGDRPVLLVGVGQGARLGLTLLHAEPRISAAVLAPTTGFAGLDAVTVPVRLVPTEGGLADAAALEAATTWLLRAPVVCLPGGPLLPPAYLSDLGGLDDHAPLVPLDLASYADRRCDRLVAEVEVARRALGRDRLTLLAHSAGANLAYRYAEHHPDRVERLVLVTPSPRGLGVEVPDVARSAVAASRHAEPWYAGAAAALARVQSGQATDVDWAAIDPFTFGRWDDAARALTAQMDAARDPRAHTEFEADGAFDPPATRAALSGLDAPVLVLAGAVDVGNPPAAMAEVAALFPRGELVVQAGAGHYPWLDDPAAFTATVTAFLERP